MSFITKSLFGSPSSDDQSEEHVGEVSHLIYEQKENLTVFEIYPNHANVVSFVKLGEDGVIRGVPSDVQVDMISFRDVTNDVPVDVLSVEKRSKVALKSFVGKRIVVGNGDNVVEGVLSHQEGNLLFLNTDNGVTVVNADLAGTVRIENGTGYENYPSLYIETQQVDGLGLLRLRYQTSTITWHVKYVLTVIDQDTAMFTSWLTLSNTSNISFPDCAVNLIQSKKVQSGYASKKKFSKTKKSQKTKSTSSNINRNSKVPVYSDILVPFEKYNVSIEEGVNTTPYIPARDIPVKFLYIFDFSTPEMNFPEQPYTSEKPGLVFNEKQPVVRYLRFLNDEGNNLGFEFPNGSGTLINEFETIDNQHTSFEITDLAIGSEELVKLGTVPGVKVQRAVRDFRFDPEERYLEEIIQFDVINDTDEEFSLEIRCPVYRAQEWTVSKFKRATDVRREENQVFVTLEIAPNKTSKCNMNIQYTWDEEDIIKAPEENTRRSRSARNSKTAQPRKFLGIF